MHIRIDSIEQIIMTKQSEGHDLEDLGYRVAYEVARDNLRLGGTVVADSVNPVAVTRRC